MEEKNEELSFRAKYLSLNFLFRVVGSIIMLNGIGVMLVGIYALGKTWYKIFTIGFGTKEHIGANIFKSIDIILIGIVFFIFGNSLKFLINKKKEGVRNGSVHDIFDIDGFLHQKQFLWSALATALLFVFITHIFKAEAFTWEFLTIPVCILLVTAAMYFMKKSH